jgi:hypothetical protein
VRSPDNEIVIPSNAVVRGRVVAVEDRPAQSIKIVFEDIETVWGRAAMGATIKSAAPYASTKPGLNGGTNPYDAALYLPASLPVLSTEEGVAAIGGGPRPEAEPAVLFLPRGAELRILLVKPLVAPPKARSMR